METKCAKSIFRSEIQKQPHSPLTSQNIRIHDKNRKKSGRDCPGQIELNEVGRIEYGWIDLHCL